MNIRQMSIITGLAGLLLTDEKTINHSRMQVQKVRDRLRELEEYNAHNACEKYLELESAPTTEEEVAENIFGELTKGTQVSDSYILKRIEEEERKREKRLALQNTYK